MEFATKSNQRFKKRELKINSIYSRCLLTRNIALPLTTIGKNIKETIENKITFEFGGKCLVEGYIKTDSLKLITHSSGLITRGTNVNFNVVFECEACFPVEGMIIQCVAKNITKAGIRAESATDVPSPVIVFIAKDHHYNVAQFAEIKEGDRFNVRVIGQRFELNDKYVSIIGELVKPKFDPEGKMTKPKLVIEDL